MITIERTKGKGRNNANFGNFARGQKLLPPLCPPGPPKKNDLNRRYVSYFSFAHIFTLFYSSNSSPKEVVSFINN